MAGAKTGAPRRARKPAKKANTSWPNTFIAALAETSNVTLSAKRARISLGHVYKRRRADAEFRRRWGEALCEGYDHLELDLLRRLREGDFATADGGKFDFACALRILAAHRDSVGAERARQSDEDEEAVYASITAKIARLRQSWEAEHARLPAPRMETCDAAG